MKEILLCMEESRNDPKAKRSYFYSAHDITIVNVMGAMGFTNELLKPDYGATLILELYLVNNGADQEVKVRLSWLSLSLKFMIAINIFIIRNAFEYYENFKTPKIPLKNFVTHRYYKL